MPFQFRSWPLVLVLIFLGCALPELGLHLTSYPQLTRSVLIQYFAFWPGLLHGWHENYAGQFLLMFFSYGLLHAGLWHFLFNMMTLFSLGMPLVEDIGQRRFALVYLVSQIGGGLCYGLLGMQAAPMVGASGALFGLAGGLLWLRLRAGLQDLPLFDALRDLAWPILLLIGMNVVMYLALDGKLAWETHLGGFLSGAATMAVLTLKRFTP